MVELLDSVRHVRVHSFVGHLTGDEFGHWLEASVGLKCLLLSVWSAVRVGRGCLVCVCVRVGRGCLVCVCEGGEGVLGMCELMLKV